jgi:uncharacterized protein (DUF58 family)
LSQPPARKLSPIAIDNFGRFERLSFVSRRAARGGLGGEHRSRNRSPSTDFVDYRPYQPGDDFRRVDWNVFGRLGSLQVKLTEGRERLDIALILDCSSSMAYGEPEKLQFAAELVAALGYIGVARADIVQIQCLVPAGEKGAVGVFRRRSRFPDLVKQLCDVAPAGLVDLNSSLANTLAAPSAHPLVVVLSDLLTPEGVSAGLDSLVATRADVVVLHILSPQEMEPRLAGGVELVDAETEETLELGVSLETLAAYKTRLAGWLDARQTECTQRGMRYVRLRTDRPLTTVILEDLRRARVLR